MEDAQDPLAPQPSDYKFFNSEQFVTSSRYQLFPTNNEDHAMVVKEEKEELCNLLEPNIELASEEDHAMVVKEEKEELCNLLEPNIELASEEDHAIVVKEEIEERSNLLEPNIELASEEVDRVEIQLDEEVYQPILQTQSSSKRKRKSNAQKQREYRERQKLRAGVNGRRPENLNGVEIHLGEEMYQHFLQTQSSTNRKRKSNAQKQREYRERKKLIAGVTGRRPKKLNAENQREYRLRQKLRKELQASTQDPLAPQPGDYNFIISEQSKTSSRYKLPPTNNEDHAMVIKEEKEELYNLLEPKIEPTSDEDDGVKIKVKAEEFCCRLTPKMEPISDEDEFCCHLPPKVEPTLSLIINNVFSLDSDNMTDCKPSTEPTDNPLNNGLTSDAPESLVVSTCEGCEMGLLQIGLISESPREVIMTLLADHGCLPTTMMCQSCGAECTYREDRHQYRCRRRRSIADTTVTCNFTSSIFMNTFFDSRMSIGVVLEFVMLWLMLPNPRHGVIMDNLGLSNHTVTDWSQFCREVVSHAVYRDSVPLGGSGKIVEIDEAKFGKKKKHNRGGISGGDWIFGGIERDTKLSFMVPLQARDTSTLLDIIEEKILPGTTIVSDMWHTYKSLSEEGNRRLSVKFIDPASGTHNKNIENVWREVRGHIPRYGQRIDMEGYIGEFYWKTRTPRLQRFHQFLKDIASLYPV